ncbi:MAG: dienelactone hydrolase family protein [Bacteroidia bacterium]|nr:dienelactone hydrolase family protein [Bacteroidia bacterium]
MKKIIFIFLFTIRFSFSQVISDSTSGFRFVAHIPKPPDKKPLPVIFLLHGYGSNEQDLFAFHQTLPDHFAFVSVRAPFGLPGGGYAWYALEMKNKEMVHHKAQAQSTHKALVKFIRTVIKKYSLDSAQSIVMGYSQGGIMAWMQVLESSCVSAAIILSSYLPKEFYFIPSVPAADKTIKKVFVAHGFSDNVIPMAWYEETMKYIKKYPHIQAEVKHYEMPHAIIGQELIDIRNFLKKIKKG